MKGLDIKETGNYISWKDFTSKQELAQRKDTTAATSSVRWSPTPSDHKAPMNPCKWLSKPPSKGKSSQILNRLYVYEMSFKIKLGDHETEASMSWSIIFTLLWLSMSLSFAFIVVVVWMKFVVHEGKHRSADIRVNVNV